MAVRGIAWLITFLLLTMMWILIMSLRLLPLDGLFQHFGSIGMTGTQSIVTMTLLPPLILIFVGWLGMGVFTPPAVTSAAPGSMASAQISSVTKPDGKLLLAAWSVVTPFGEVRETIEGSRNQEKLFRPDDEIRDADGHPVHSAIIKELSLENLGYPNETRSRAMRVSAMLVSVLNTLHNQQEDLNISAASPVVIYWQIPMTMSADNQTRLHFDTAWRSSSWHDIAYDLHLLLAPESAYGALNAMQLHMLQANTPRTLLLAADSLIDPNELMMLLSQRLVFSGKNVDGFVPAEGAAGLLLVDAAFAASAQLGGLCALGPVQRGLRTSDRTVKGKIDSSTLTTCITGAMAASKITAGEIGNVISDTDHRFARSGEVIEAMGETLPELDPLSQRIAPMAYAGSFGVASDLIHIALAAEMTTATEQAALVVSVASARQTAAMMIFPGHV